MCLEFYLILKVAGAKQSLLWKMIIYSLVMLVTGYWGEVVDPGNAAAWGFASGVAYFLIVYEIWIGEAAKLAKAAGGNTLAAHKILCWLADFWVVRTDGWYRFVGKGSVDAVYNIADAINKMGLVIYTLAVKSQTN
jgi:hypothetical protein